MSSDIFYKKIKYIINEQELKDLYFIIWTSIGRGAERFSINLAKSITDQNIEVDLIIINKNNASLK